LLASELRAAARVSSSALAARWFLESPIQDASGGVSRYYRADTGLRLPNSTEITGYALKGLITLNELEAASRAAEYLTLAWSRSLEVFPFEVDDGGRWAYFFDSGIIARGLLAWWRVTGEARFRDLAYRTGESMIRYFEASDGYHPILELPSFQPAPYTEWWSRNPGSFQLKAALAWKELHEETGEARFAAHFDRQLAYSLASIRRMIASEPDELRIMDRLHAYCYFLEGLLPVADRHGFELAVGIGEVAGHLRRLDRRFARSDVYAQLLRVRLLAAALNAVDLDNTEAEREARRLADFQMESPDPILNGAFAFGRRDGVLIPHANPVSTLFAAQALEWWHTRPSVTWRDLI
jgi:hypothetical protein